MYLRRYSMKKTKESEKKVQTIYLIVAKYDTEVCIYRDHNPWESDI